MASSNSRIPKPPSSKGFKRPSENQPPLKEKRPRINVRSASKSHHTSSLKRAYSVSSLNGFSDFSDSAKKAILQPQCNIANSRESMPAKSVTAKTETGRKPKRPAWDLKGRIQDMEENFLRSQKINNDLKQELGVYNHRIAVLEQTNTQLYQDVETKSVQSQEASSTIEKLEMALRNKEEEMVSSLKVKDLQFEELKLAKESLEQQLGTIKMELKLSLHQSADLRATVTNLTTANVCIQSKLETTKLLLAHEKEEVEKLMLLNEKLKAEIEREKFTNAFLENKIREEETIRRKLHNTIQELKGNIRVFCRVRPPLQEEIKGRLDIPHIQFPDSENKSVSLLRLSDTSLNENAISTKSRCPTKYDFEFDRVFEPSSSQAEVFEEISQLVQSVLDGYNVCVFAYGQTGSGKTYTMEGPENIADFVLASENPNVGVIPRAIQQIFVTAESLKSKGWKYSMEASFLEIYNEIIKDLLSDQSNGARCEIKMSGAKGIDSYVSNLTTVSVTCAKQVYDLLKKARINRAVAVTYCNEHSSRSHYVFRLKLHSENNITQEKCEGILNLVDLAGSERLKESCSEGDRLKETKSINLSLSNLGNVIMALGQKADHVPYRNSKLTHLLMNSLGGNSKTLMFVNISPNEEHFNETLNSLRFATKLKNGAAKSEGQRRQQPMKR